MAIKEYLKNGEVFYHVNVRVGSSKGLRVQKNKKGIRTFKKAKVVEKELLLTAQEELVWRKLNSMPWGSLVDLWELSMRETHQPRARMIQETTIRENVSAIRKHTKHWFKIPSNKLTRADAHKLFNALLDKGLSNARVKGIKGAINVVFRWGIECGHVSLNESPVAGFRFKQIQDRKPPILSLTEIQLLLVTAKEMKHDWYPVWLVALHTGMRSGELFALEWDDVDFESKRIVVHKSYCQKLKRAKSTKGGYWREVPINSELLSFLKSLKLGAKSGFVLPRLPRWKNGDAAKVLKTFCLGIGLKPVHFHVLRSCFATQLIKDGVAPAIVMKICGWQDLKTMQRYVRLAGVEVEGATDTLSLVQESSKSGQVIQLFQ
jgi:integrase